MSFRSFISLCFLLFLPYPPPPQSLQFFHVISTFFFLHTLAKVLCISRFMNGCCRTKRPK
ncbi:hypothetical protein BCR44DRAFT_1174507 [Catenaria anguillulae PL171]|uniref:Uncharacterized protein n=1 Tax=Catenaria anguillulae PL171 TaxID=765915 RepID=A0A1Y2I0Q1_9FUNG|nr:hypothetical protein BCR44DRAFT_1174507 [Catenaria anguillulae PL171]